MLDALKSLALRYDTPSGHLSIWMLPFTSLRTNITYEAFTAIVPRDKWELPQVVFANFDAYVLDVKASKDASPIERVFSLLWERRGDELAARWELFQQLYSDAFLSVFNAAYDATRDRTFDAPPAAITPPESADPESSPATPPTAAA